MSYIKKIAVIMVMVLCCTACDSLEGDLDSMRAISTLNMVDAGSFQIGKYPVTRAAYDLLMKEKPTDLLSTKESKDSFKEKGAFPAANVSWYDAIAFCNKLSIKQGLEPAYSIIGKTDPEDWSSLPKTNWNKVKIEKDSDGYRLPTEAQWLYAAKGGKKPQGYTYSGSNDPNAVAWYKGNSKGRHPVGTLKPNGLGIYDMSGNVEEWCWISKEEEGTGVINPVTRGGSWKSSIDDLSLDSPQQRQVRTPAAKGDYIGFRLVRP